MINSTCYKFLLIIFIIGCEARDAENIQADICILGGSEAGFTAAIQAARMGKKVVLIEPTGHPGGMTVEGLGKDIRFGNACVIGGIAREFYIAVEHHYGLSPRFHDPSWYSRYEPSVAESVIDILIVNEPNIQMILKTRIKESGGVLMEGNEIREVRLANGMNVKAKMFIDASIEGYLLHFAGVKTEMIREGNEKYGEHLNGVQGVTDFKQFTVNVDPYIIPGDSSSGLIPTIQKGELGEHGSPSKYIMGFCFRMVLTKNPDNVIPIEKPNGYDPNTYEIYRRYLNAGGQLFKPVANRHNGKTDLGSWHDLSANLYGENWMYPTGSYDVQDSVVGYHRDFSIGLIYFLQNDPAMDSLTRSNWRDWGLPKDEFQDNGNWPRRLYIRSARRMVSDYVITEYNTRFEIPDTVSDPVAIAWWPPDMHHARRIVVDGYAYNEGFTHVENDGSWKPFKISYQALVPKPTECINLITPTCVSSSYVGYGSVRILPTFMILGQSSGAAAALAIDKKLSIQKINYADLRNILRESDQILDLPSDWKEIISANN